MYKHATLLLKDIPIMRLNYQYTALQSQKTSSDYLQIKQVLLFKR